MWLRAEHRTDLEYALEYAHHDFLVELGTLSQVCVAPKIFNREHVRAALGRSADQLRRLYLGEVTAIQRGPEARHNARCQLQHRTAVQCTVPNDCMVQEHWQRGL